LKNLLKRTWAFLFDAHVPHIVWLLIILLIVLQYEHSKLTKKLEVQQNIIKQSELQQQHQIDIINTTVAVLHQENLKRQDVKRQISEFLQQNCSRDPRIKTKIPIIQAYIMYASDLFDIRPQFIADILVSESSCNSKAINADSKAKGLMQVNKVHHPEVFTNDLENVIKGVAILKDCMDKWGNIEPKALACYQGVKNIQ
jgi:hypothetical protein